MVKSFLIHSMNELLNTFQDSKQNLLLLVAEGSDFDHSKLSEIKGSVCGAIFPQVIYGEKHYIDAIVVIELSHGALVTLTSFSDFDKSKIDSEADDIVLFVDGLSSGITNFLEELYESTSIKTNIVGAGAGKMTLKQGKVLFTKESIIQDGALLLSNSWHISTSAKHGWEKIAGPYIANDVEDTTLHSLDYVDAFKIYKKIVEKDSGLSFNENNFFDLAKSYPLGISRIGNELLVRDPISKKNNSLVLVGNMDNNSVVFILKGNKEKLINSARLATKEAISKKANLKGIFIIDCISRMLFLEDDFKKELQVIKKSVESKDLTMFGVLSLGEIANT
ncbi:MAG: FIST C-terminal domain-containing protein, partial [Sulfurimonas sp.]|nr:FIST C-terminal domain-containing protein [Sulfurimonas sp.]